MRKIAHPLWPALSSLTLAGFAHLISLPQELGAHPWWADKVIWIGLPIGLALVGLAWVLSIPRNLQLVGFTLFALAAFLAAQGGKTQFAASYAEDLLAGQIWYFGWVVTCALTTAASASLFCYTRKVD